MHFFDECSVIKTTGNRNYGHAARGMSPIEVQRYASNATFTVNLLHNMGGVGHVNLLPGPSNGLELLNFFAEAIEEEDYFGNSLLKVGDTVIMDNCGFHHAIDISNLSCETCLPDTELAWYTNHHITHSSTHANYALGS